MVFKINTVSNLVTIVVRTNVVCPNAVRTNLEAPANR
jgi:hypothetical protein